MGYKEKDGCIEREEVEIGKLSLAYLGKFVNWCEYVYRGHYCSKLIGISVISTGMNIFDVIKEIKMSAERMSDNDVKDYPPYLDYPLK